MSLTLDKDLSPEARKARFVEIFRENIPVGSRVKNPFIPPTELAETFFARTVAGEIYSDPNSEYVNVTDINGEIGMSGRWTASCVSKID